jgi:hypothetical protein
MKNYLMLFLLFFGIQLTAQQSITESQKIDHLVSFVRNLRGAIFIRNGSEHPPTDAANHLQMKREKAGARIKTAKDFVEKIGTKSSISGDLYTIRFANGKEFPCQMVLFNELKKLEGGSAAKK